MAMLLERSSQKTRSLRLRYCHEIDTEAILPVMEELDF